jgi:hypothetical protein
VRGEERSQAERGGQQGMEGSGRREGRKEGKQMKESSHSGCRVTVRAKTLLVR